MSVDVERIIAAQLAEHGDGARALDVAEQASGLPRRHLEEALWRILAGKRGQPAPPIRWAPRNGRVARMGICPLCRRYVAHLPDHVRRQHPQGVSA